MGAKFDGIYWDPPVGVKHEWSDIAHNSRSLAIQCAMTPLIYRVYICEPFLCLTPLSDTPV